MAVIDPSGWQATVILRTGRGSYTLWTGGAISPQGESMFIGGEGFQDVPIVEGFDIEVSPGLNGKISINISAPYDLGVALLNSELFGICNVFEVQIGYPRLGLFLPWFSGVATKPSIRWSGDEGLTATLNIEGAAFAAQRSGQSLTYENYSYAEVINEVAGFPHNNWTVELPDEERGGEDPLYVERASVSQGNNTEWRWLYELCRSARCEMYLLPNSDGGQVLRVIRTASAVSGEPQTTFVLRGRSDFINSFPIFEFESEAEFVWLPRGNAPIVFDDINPDDLSYLRGAVTQDDRVADGQQRMREVSVAPGEVEEVGETTVAALPEQGRVLPASARDPRSTEAMAAQEADEDALRGGFYANVSTIGLPHLFPGMVVAIDESAGVFAGNYQIESMTHRVAPGEWSATYRLRTNAIGGHLMEFLQQLNADYNDQSAPENEEATGGGEEVGVEVTAEEEEV